MNCDRVRELLQEGLDGHPVPDEAARHLDECESCRTYSAEMERVDAWLTEEPGVAWRPALTAGVMRRVRRGRAIAIWQVAAAAALLLACLWIGSDALGRVPAVAEAGVAVTAGVTVPRSTGEALDALAGGFERATASLTGAAESTSRSPASAWLIGGLLALLAFDGLRLIGRRRRS